MHKALFLDEELQPAVGVLLGDRHHEAEVRDDELLLRGLGLDLDIAASDQAGNRQELKLPLVLDNQKPALTIEEAALSGGRLQVRGLASDDVGVDRVVVHYGDTFSRLNLPQGESVPFAVNLPVESLTVIAVDAAGNRIEVKVP